MQGDALQAYEARMEEWAADAGVVLVQESPTYNVPIIRGIGLGLSSVNPPVTTYVDDIPILSFGLYENAGIAGNMDTFDMENVTVLKGPQGPEYGANALGGVIQYVTRAPDLQKFSAAVDAGFSSVEGGTGYSTHGMLNLPFGEGAVRLTAFDSYYPGFVSDRQRGRRDINGEHVSGGRASLLWVPSDEVSIRLTAMLQQTRVGDTSDIAYDTSGKPTYGRYEVEQSISSPIQDRDDALNATIKWDSGAVQVISSTSLVHVSRSDIFDESSAYGGVFPSYGGAAGLEATPVSDFIQDIRLTSKTGQRFSWQSGLEYEHNMGHNNQYLVPADISTRQVIYAPAAEAFETESSYLGRSAFGSIDYFLVPQVLDIDAAVRYAENHQSFSEMQGGSLITPKSFFVPSHDHSTTASADLKWHPSSSWTAYARVASGYSPGGPNPSPVGSRPYDQYGPSTTINYEIGANFGAPDGPLTATVALYEINWHHIQVYDDDPAVNSITSNGAAVSRGVEWNVGYAPAGGLKFQISGAYTDAHLTKELSSAEGADAGDALPYVPRWAGNLSAEYKRPISSSLSAFAGAELRPTEARPAEFPYFGGPRVTLPATQVVDLKAGLQYLGVTATVYVHNLTDQVVFTSLVPQGGTSPQLATTLPPRTVGFDLSASW